MIPDVSARREGHCLSWTNHGFHRLFYSDWGPVDGPPVLCVHGLTGNGHDFDHLAEALSADGYRVVAVDMPGRGRSDFLADPQDYNYRQYGHDLTVLMAHIGITADRPVDFVGISMGGLLGIMLAGQKNTPIRRLVVNDIGPTVPQDMLDFIYDVIAQEYHFITLQEMEETMRRTRGATWGPITDSQWTKMAEDNARALPDGKLTYAFDPAIAAVFKTEPTGSLDLWSCWETVQNPALILRGEDSLVFPEAVAHEMIDRAARPDTVTLETIANCGHVPSLLAPQQIDLVTSWLQDTAYT